MKTLPEFCFETLSKEISLEHVPGLEDLEHVKLLSGEEGGGIKIYRGEKLEKVTLVDFRLGKGLPLPQYDNRLSMGAELFQILPDLSYKLPIWGINSIIMKDGDYYFDTDYSFGFDLVMDYDYTMKYLEPFNAIYKKFSNHPDFKRVTLDETTTWVRSYISPAFIIAETTTAKANTVYDLCAEMIKLWATMYKDAVQRDEGLKESQQKRIKAQYEGMKETDRMAKVLLEVYGKETFGKFFKAMS
jgi:hypothetical protein